MAADFSDVISYCHSAGFQDIYSLPKATGSVGLLNVVSYFPDSKDTSIPTEDSRKDVSKPSSLATLFEGIQVVGVTASKENVSQPSAGISVSLLDALDSLRYLPTLSSMDKETDSLADTSSVSVELTPISANPSYAS